MTLRRRTGHIFTHDFAQPFNAGAAYQVDSVEGSRVTFHELEDVTLLTYPDTLKLVGGAIVDARTMSATRPSVYPPFVESVQLSRHEWALYRILAACPNEMVTYDAAYKGANVREVSIRQLVQRLRGKLGPYAVEVVRGRGLVLAVESVIE